MDLNLDLSTLTGMGSVEGDSVSTFHEAGPGGKGRGEMTWSEKGIGTGSEVK